MREVRKIVAHKSTLTQGSPGIPYRISVYFLLQKKGAPTITFSAAADVPITSRAVGTLKIFASDVQGDTHVVASERACYVPNQPHDFAYVSQLTNQHACTWKPPIFVNCTRLNDVVITFEFAYDIREFSWKIDPISSVGIDTVDSVINPLAVIKIFANIDSMVTLRPTGHPRRGRPKPAAISTHISVHTTPPAAANFRMAYGLPVCELNKREKQAHGDWQLVKSKF